MDKAISGNEAVDFAVMLVELKLIDFFSYEYFTIYRLLLERLNNAEIVLCID